MEEYKLVKFQEKDYGKFTVKLSILQFTNSYSIIMYFHDKLYDSYYVKQFNDEKLAVIYLESKTKGSKL